MFEQISNKTSLQPNSSPKVSLRSELCTFHFPVEVRETTESGHDVFPRLRREHRQVSSDHLQHSVHRECPRVETMSFS